jgi:ribose/xylose/arabinose/galactoside ABC-type transport system permease subunit
MSRRFAEPKYAGHRLDAIFAQIDPATVGPSIALAAMLIGFSILSSHFLTRSNLTNVLVQSAPLLTLATGQTFALLMGGLDLSQGSIISSVW